MLVLDKSSSLDLFVQSSNGTEMKLNQSFASVEAVSLELMGKSEYPDSRSTLSFSKRTDALSHNRTCPV